MGSKRNDADEAAPASRDLRLARALDGHQRLIRWLKNRRANGVEATASGRDLILARDLPEIEAVVRVLEQLGYARPQIEVALEQVCVPAGESPEVNAVNVFMMARRFLEGVYRK